MDINEINYKDRSEFLRGFATIIRKNSCGNLDGKNMFLIIGRYFGFEKEFCEYAAEHLLANKYISEHPAIFSNKSLAEFFISDVSKIMLHTNSMSNDAKQWLLKTAEVNEVEFNLYEFDLE